MEVDPKAGTTLSCSRTGPYCLALWDFSGCSAVSAGEPSSAVGRLVPVTSRASDAGAFSVDGACDGRASSMEDACVGGACNPSA